ncbi:stage II sporulation protein R [Pseudobacillus badius]|uniref:stage II sporulation protein R n=1 Tax=Bacillus badius TaxID=1455 RepID=UPI003CE9EDAC
MNRLIAGIYLLILSIGTILSLYIPDHAAEAEETIVIPKEAIRLRILANSDSAVDQELKRKIRDDVNEEITKWVAGLDSLPEARRLLKSKLPEIEEIAMKRAEKEGIQAPIKVNFGKAKFPTKLYGQFLYPAGEYEAIVITVGKGEGANWWCVLYPPLCFLDFSNGAAVSPGVEESSQPDQDPNLKQASDQDPNQDPNLKQEPEQEREPVYAEGEPEKPEIKLAIVELFKRKDS